MVAGTSNRLKKIGESLHAGCFESWRPTQGNPDPSPLRGFGMTTARLYPLSVKPYLNACDVPLD
jgi:hypothetical protein